MKWNKYKLCLWKAYFEKGYMLTNFLKYLIFLLGVGEAVIQQTVAKTMFLAIAYGVGCFIFGWAWYRFGWINAEIEVSNRFNEFVKEVRNSKLFKDKKSAK